MRREIKHGKHDQSSHGRRTSAGKAGKRVFAAARASASASLADARAAGRRATVLAREDAKIDREIARSERLSTQAKLKRREAESGQVTAALLRRLLESADRLEARARGEKVGPRQKATPPVSVSPSPSIPVSSTIETPPVRRFDSPQDAANYMENRMRIDVSESEGQALRGYQETLYSSVNDGLREQRFRPSENETVRGIDSVMQRSRTQDNIEVYRGMRFGDDAFDEISYQLEVGRVFTDRGFISTTLDKGQAEDFSRGYRQQSVMLNIRVPAGTPAVYMDGAVRAGFSQREKELLIDRSTPMRVVGRRETTNGIEVDLEVIP